MKITAIKTRAFLPPQDDLPSFLKEAFKTQKPKENCVVVITSKVVAIGQGRCVKIEKSVNKGDLVKQEADAYAWIDTIFGTKGMVTIKNNTMVSKAGIDESNANGYYALWPEKPFAAAKEIYDFIKKEYSLKKFGVVISDSHRMPFRLGITGISIAYYGFKPLYDYRGSKDIFGRKLKFSEANVVDSLAAASVLEMGEGNEQTPLSIIEDIKNIEFTGGSEKAKDNVSVALDGDIFSPLFKSIKWKKRKKAS